MKEKSNIEKICFNQKDRGCFTEEFDPKRIFQISLRPASFEIIRKNGKEKVICKNDDIILTESINMDIYEGSVQKAKIECFQNMISSLLNQISNFDGEIIPNKKNHERI